jgi:hypothetical protein
VHGKGQLGQRVHQAQVSLAWWRSEDGAVVGRGHIRSVREI